MTPEGEHLALRQEEAIKDSFARQAFMNHLGARLMTVRRGWCEVIVDYRPESQPTTRIFSRCSNRSHRR
jgi:hypothetical protein